MTNVSWTNHFFDRSTGSKILEKIAEETAINGYAWHHTSLKFKIFNK